MSGYPGTERRDFVGTPCGSKTATMERNYRFQLNPDTAYA